LTKAKLTEHNAVRNRNTHEKVAQLSGIIHSVIDQNNKHK